MNFVHETAVIDKDVSLGENISVWHFSHIMQGSKIGDECILGQNVMIGPNVLVGKGCKIQNNVSLYEGVEIDDYVFCGPSCVFTNVIKGNHSIGTAIFEIFEIRGRTTNSQCRDST